jgi:hypothetical protein
MNSEGFSGGREGGIKFDICYSLLEEGMLKNHLTPLSL